MGRIKIAQYPDGIIAILGENEQGYVPLIAFDGWVAFTAFLTDLTNFYWERAPRRTAIPEVFLKAFKE